MLIYVCPKCGKQECHSDIFDIYLCPDCGTIMEIE